MAEIEYTAEKIEDAWDAALPLMFENERETGTGVPEGLEFRPDKARFVVLEKAGVAQTFAMRANGELVGYAAYVLGPHLHYLGKWAMQDALYVSPKWRGMAGVKFILWMDDQLRSMGIDSVYRHVTLGNDYSRVLESTGYVQIERGYFRRIS